MQIGVMNHPARDPVGEIEWIGTNGFDFVDFTLEPPAADPDQIDTDAIRAALDRHGLGVVAHTAYYLPLASPFASVRRACLEEFRRALRAAQRIGATVMNMHFDTASIAILTPFLFVARFRYETLWQLHHCVRALDWLAFGTSIPSHEGFVPDAPGCS